MSGSTEANRANMPVRKTRPDAANTASTGQTRFAAGTLRRSPRRASSSFASLRMFCAAEENRVSV